MGKMKKIVLLFYPIKNDVKKKFSIIERNPSTPINSKQVLLFTNSSFQNDQRSRCEGLMNGNLTDVRILKRIQFRANSHHKLDINKETSISIIKN
jgi:hypothetical protein